MQTHSSKVHFPELDGIRGLAILLVLAWHYIASLVQVAPGTAYAYVLKLLSLTWGGVDLFFVLSGFLIGGILLDNRTAPNYFKTFYVRRLCRIFPLYYFMFALFAVATSLGLGKHGTELSWLYGDPLPLWSYATYLQNFVMASYGIHGANWMGITWSLAIEEQFYVVLPLLVRFAPPRTLPWLLGILVSFAPAFRGATFLWHSQGGFPGYVLLFGRWDALFLGTLGAYYLRRTNARSWLVTRIHWIRILVGVCFLSMVGLLAGSQSIGSAGMSFFGHTVLAIMCLALIILARLSLESRTRRFFSAPLLGWFGLVSYGIYLFHQPVLGLLHGVLR